VTAQRYKIQDSKFSIQNSDVKTIVRKVQWQIKFLKPFASERVMIFVNEPVLAAYGSSTYIYVSEEADNQYQPALNYVQAQLAKYQADDNLKLVGRYWKLLQYFEHHRANWVKDRESDS